MNDWEQSLKELMPLVVAAGMPAAINSMTRVLVRPKLEKKLGRRLTEQDWQVYREEQAIKQMCLEWAYILIQCCQQLIDRQEIREFVWGQDA